jgi:serpin B
MHLRRLLGLLTVAALLLAACGDDEPAAGGLVESTVPRTAADPSSVDALADALDTFGGDLYGAIVRSPALAGRNVAVSPYSVASALLLTRAGARNVTREELDRALHLGAIDADAGFNAIDQALATRALTRRDPDGRELQLRLSTANAVWGQEGYPIEQAFLDVLAEWYGAGLHTVDYGDAESARRTINGWVGERTADKIPELIPEGVLDPLVRIVLTNALYLKASWATPFDERATSDGAFVRRDGSSVTARFMRQTEPLGFARGAGWRAVDLPYVGDQLSMLVIVPEASRFDAVEVQFGRGVEAFAAEVRPAQVRLALPRFTFRTQTELTTALGSLGIEQLFDPDRADLSGMTAAERLYVSDVLHEAYLAVTEEGTEAAAATAVVARATAAPTEVEELTVDRPFLFAIRDRATGAVLLQGRVLDPTAG